MKTGWLMVIILGLLLCVVACHSDTHPLSQSDPVGGTYLSGVDVSQYDYGIDWDSLDSAVDFAIMKSSEGVSSTDPYFARNQSGARRVGMLRGYYHFCRPDLGNSATAEADWMLSVIGPLMTGEVLCLDFEVAYASPVTWCLAFLNRIYSQTGIKPFLYINLNTVNSYNWSPVISAGYPLWLAVWDGNPNPATPTTPWGFTAIKQYNAEQNIHVGSLTNADVDSFNGDAAAFRAYGRAATSDTQPPTVPTNLSGSAASSTQVNLTWTASTDNVGVVGYKVYRNNMVVATTTTNSCSDTTVVGDAVYTYAVAAYDAESNESARSNTIAVTTPYNPETLTNGGFETGNTTGWTAYSRTSTPVLSAQATGVKCGTYYLYEQLTTMNTAGGVLQTVTGLTNGATYTISGWRKSVHADVAVSVKVDTNGGTDYNSAEITVASGATAAGTWTSFSQTITATGTSMTIFLDSSQSGGTKSGHVGAFDCLSLTGPNCTPPSPPVSASANPATVSPGGTSTLTAVGGSGTTCKWFSGSCGGTLVGTGMSITVNPASATTYYARWENACGNSTCAAASVSITPAPTLTAITPSSAPNTGTTAITNLAGTGFASGATVKLRRTGQPDITATGVTVVNSTKITCNLDLTGKKTGLWSVQVTNPDAQNATLANAFGMTVSGSLPVVGTTIDSLLDTVATPGSLNRRFRVWGKVTVINSSTFWLDDGSGAQIKVFAPGYTGFTTGSYVSALGTADVSVTPPVLISSSDRIRAY